MEPNRVITRRQRMSYKEKYELIQEVRAGASRKSIMSKYHITSRMYNRVIDSEPEVLEKVKKFEFETKKSSKTSNYICLDAGMITWFKQARDRGDPITGPIIQERARMLNEELGGPSTFKVRKLTKENCNL